MHLNKSKDFMMEGFNIYKRATRFPNSAYLLILSLIVCLTMHPIQAQSNAKKCLEIHESYLDNMFYLVKNTVGFSAPVSARAYAYVTLAMYESTYHTLESLESLLPKTAIREVDYSSFNLKEIHWELVANEVNYYTLRYFFRGMSQHDSLQLTHLYQDTEQFILGNKRLKRKHAPSKKLGQHIAEHIITFSKTDGGDEGFNRNFPDDFTPPSCPSCWVKTTPGYLSALLPYWGSNASIINTNLYPSFTFIPLEFSTDTSSILYKDALEVLAIGLSDEEHYEIISEYWDDAPGISGTPPGHLFQIAEALRKSTQLSTSKALQLYAFLGMSLNEAFITCWELKYTHHFIRPITYIHRNIDNRFNTRIDTPPFPESPSGHSFQSGAGTQVLIHFFGNELTFTDSTNINRPDILGHPRTFHSLNQMSQEISISRLYGGIHFRSTLDNSLESGRIIGENFLRYMLHSDEN